MVGKKVAELVRRWVAQRDQRKAVRTADSMVDPSVY